MSITIVVLAPARQSAKRAADLAHQRQVGAILIAYTHDNDGLFPYWGSPGETFMPRYSTTGEFMWNDRWNYQIFNYGHHMEQRGYDGWASGWTPGGPKRIKPTNPDYIWQSVHWLTRAAYANPRWFAENSVFDLADRNIAQRISSVAFTSVKGMVLLGEYGPDDDTNHSVWDVWDANSGRFEKPPGSQLQILIATFMDGHAEARLWPDFREPRRIPDVNEGDSALPILNTVDGMFVRDI